MVAQRLADTHAREPDPRRSDAYRVADNTLGWSCRSGCHADFSAQLLGSPSCPAPSVLLLVLLFHRPFFVPEEHVRMNEPAPAETPQARSPP